MGCKTVKNIQGTQTFWKFEPFSKNLNFLEHFELYGVLVCVIFAVIKRADESSAILHHHISSYISHISMLPSPCSPVKLLCYIFTGADFIQNLILRVGKGDCLCVALIFADFVEKLNLLVT